MEDVLVSYFPFFKEDDDEDNDDDGDARAVRARPSPWPALRNAIFWAVFNDLLHRQTLRLIEWALFDNIPERYADKLCKNVVKSARRKHERSGRLSASVSIVKTTMWANALGVLTAVILRASKTFVFTPIYNRLFRQEQKVISLSVGGKLRQTGRSVSYFSFFLLTCGICPAIGTMLLPGRGTGLGLQVGEIVIPQAYNIMF